MRAMTKKMEVVTVTEAPSLSVMCSSWYSIASGLMVVGICDMVETVLEAAFEELQALLVSHIGG